MKFPEKQIYQSKKGQALLLLFLAFFLALGFRGVSIAIELAKALAFAAPAFILGQAHVDAKERATQGDPPAR